MTPAREPLITSELLNHLPVALDARSQSQSRVFTVYNSYRALLASSLLALLVWPASADFVAPFDHLPFITGCMVLLFSALVLAFAPGRQLRQSETSIVGLMLLDITAMALIAAGSGGILSGFSVLYLITTAAAAVLLRTRILATLIAALAVLAVLADTLWLVTRGQTNFSMLLPAGILGSLMFAVSLLMQLTSHRLTRAEAQAESARAQVAALQELNQRIIQHLHTGILLVTETGRLLPINQAGAALLNIPASSPSDMLQTSPTLAQQYQSWRDTGRNLRAPFKVQDDSPQVIASFSALREPRAGESLVFIEDYTPVTQFAQSIKLNSLSKLTASIAHEIRNPLAAIRHAAQLLDETPNLAAGDKTLCDIMVKNSDRVSDIISSVMDVSRRAAPSPTDLDINRWLEHFCSDYEEQRAAPCRLQLGITPGSVIVLCDRAHLQRIVTNLLDNALRHSALATGRAWAELRVLTDPINKYVHLDVIDEGPGVDDDNIHRLFEPFFTTSREGSGLGLYLAKELCELNGLGIAYQRTAQGMSAFRISFRHDESFQ